MVDLQSEIKRGFLRSLYRSTLDTSQTLGSVLNAFQSQGFTALKTGRLMTSTSGGGYSVSFDAPGIGRQFTQDVIFALSEMLLSVYDSAVAILFADDSNFDADDSDNNLEIFNQMMAMDAMQGVSQWINDYTLTRWPPVGPGQT